MYYTLPSFVTKILKFEVENFDDEDNSNPQQQQSPYAPQTGEPANAKDNNTALRKKLVKSGMKLIHELQILFASMALGKKKYLDPNGVLKAVVDDQGD